MKKILLLFCLSIFVTTLSAQRFESNGLHFAVTSASTVEVVPSPSKYAGDITIPATVMHDSITYKVTTIGRFAFHNCASLTSVVIPDGVISIGGWAFYKSPNLTSVSIPNTVTNIGQSAFAYCSSLISIKLPNNLTVIDYYLFQYCSSLTYVVLPQKLQRIGHYAFTYCTSLKRIAIPTNVDWIGNTAFSYCPSLDNIIVESDNGHFDSRNNCNAIIKTSTKELVAGCNNTIIPNGVVQILAYAFTGSSIDSIFIPQSVTTIELGAFADCRHLTRIIVDSTNTTFDSRNNCNAIIKKSNIELVSGCNSTIIPNTVKLIGCYAFAGSAIDSVVIPYSVRGIGSGAFRGCSQLAHIIVESGNQFYDSRDNCNAIIASKNHTQSGFYWGSSDTSSQTWDANTLIAGCKNTVIPNTVTSIGSSAFRNCSALTSINIPNSVSSIGSSAFYNCSALTSINLPNSVSSIGSYAFYNCSALTSINIPNNLSSISSYTFSGCTSLASISIPLGVTTIDSYAFDNCTSLKSIAIPWSVMSIAPRIFQGCTSLSSITVEDGNFYYDSRDNCNAIIETATNELVAGCNNTVIPNTIDSIGQYAFYENTFSSITIPNSVKNIETCAFFYCPNLFHITIPESVTTIAPDAFWGSSSLVSVTSLADTPATLGADAFCSLPICNIPCGATAKYTAAANWKSFVAGFDEMCEEIVEESQSICHGESYEWDKTGETYSETGRYTYDTDSVQYILNLTVLPLVPQSNDSVTICHGETYTWNGQTYSTAGEYSVTLSDINGCDSVATLHLTIYDAIPETIVQDTICLGDTYTWNGQTYSTAGEYSVTLSNINGCDSVVILYLTIKTTATAEEHITACNSYTWNNETYTQSGEYTYTTVAVNGCDSIITLYLTINQTLYADETVVACDSYAWNDTTYTQSGDYTYTTTAANGCDSVVTLHLTINQTQYAEETVVACDSYVWNGETYTQSGDYTFTTVATNGCDSIVTLHLTIGNSKVGETEYVTICHGETYTWKGQTYSNSGDYSITLSSALGCDSIVTLHLTIMPEAFTTTETVVIGSNELPYTWRGNTYSATGHYTKTEQYTHVACDSAIHFLDLTVLTTGKFDEQSVTICDTEAPYQWYGKSYTTTGKYTYTEKYAGTNIDSIQHILNLTIHPTVYTEEHIAACNSYTWNGETYTQSGTYTYTTATINGCDSIVTLHLTINNTIYAEEHVTACDSYTWNGQTYSTTGAYTYTTTAANGCDSIVTLHLTIHQTQYAEEHITACDSYEWNGQTYTQSGTHTYNTIAANGCDSIVTLHLTINTSMVGTPEYATICYGETYTWNGQTYSTAGEYSITLSNALGCDSVATLLLTILPEAVTLEESVTLNEELLPYIWREQSCDHAGVYTISEPFANYPYCDSVIYVLNLTTEAPNKCGDNLYWHYSNNTLSITGSGAMYDNPDLLSYRNEPWYPARVNNIVLSNDITHIGNVAFADCANLTNIDIPSSVTSIGDGAFSWTGLLSVTIPASVTELGEQVFETCNNLHTILYEGTPSSISNQTIHPFIGCVHLDTIITPAELWHCTSADPVLEARYGVPNKARYIEVTNGFLTNQALAYITQSVTTLKVLDLTNATNTTLPYGVLSDSYQLTTLYLPQQIEVIPESMVEGGHNLTEILIPATVTEIGNHAFAGCANVWRMTVEAILPPKVYANTFDGIDRSISLIVPAGSEDLYRQAEYWREFFIEHTNSPSPISNCQKILREDHILILREGKVYTTMGQLINVGE